MHRLFHQSESLMALQALSTKFLTLLRNHPDSITDAQVREYFENEGSGEYEKLPPVINTLMSEVRPHFHLPIYSHITLVSREESSYFRKEHLFRMQLSRKKKRNDFAA